MLLNLQNNNPVDCAPLNILTVDHFCSTNVPIHEKSFNMIGATDSSLCRKHIVSMLKVSEGAIDLDESDSEEVEVEVEKVVGEQSAKQKIAYIYIFMYDVA